jgi:predicted methyltransferase
MSTDPAPRIALKIALASLALAACRQAPAEPVFPPPDRPVSRIVSPRWSTEAARDKASEAATVMDLSGIRAGMTVADIGAGEGYYTVRLARRVGKHGRVLAQDVVPAVRDALAARATREALDNVSVKLGKPDDPMLPPASFDRILLVHMYHEIAQPYAFLWQLRPALKPGGEVVVVDADRPTAEHGTPPDLLACEFGALGYRRVKQMRIDSGTYLATFAAEGARPDANAVRSCKQ